MDSKNKKVALGAVAGVAVGLAGYCLYRRFATNSKASAATGLAAQEAQDDLRLDPSTSSNYKDFKVTSLHLSLGVDFKLKQLAGSALITGEALRDGLKQVLLDTRGLNISDVTDASSGAKLEYKLVPHATNPAVFGETLIVDVPRASLSDTVQLRVAYTTSPDSSAVQWLAPEQTAGKTHPYMFTQCQAIHARSLMPCQDTPCNKFVYTADITVDSALVALMSAKGVGVTDNGNQKTFRFDQPRPIPAYLLAIAVGALVSRDIGPRSKVWAEQEQVDAGAYEFADTEKFLQAAEEITGIEYPWGQYDVLLLPPSFPYGGMENPCLTFATPTLLAGDRSLAGVVAHEISHSWTGNLVTNSSWEHFWLNEGFTVFLERKILEKVEGADGGKAYACDSIVGQDDLADAVRLFGADSPFTHLVPRLAGVDPDDAFSTVPYEKGFNFLTYLETLVGKEAFNGFLRAYLRHFSYKSLHTTDFKRFLLGYFAENAPANGVDLSSAVNWNQWLHEPGMPPVTNKFDRTYHDAAQELAEAWAALDASDAKAVADIKAKADWGSWSAAYQQIPFLSAVLALAEEGKVSLDVVKALDEAYNLSQAKNSEILFLWLKIALRAKHSAVFPTVVRFATEQGRMKFVRPLYRELAATGSEGMELARKTFAEHRGFYHPICQKMVAQDLGL